MSFRRRRNHIKTKNMIEKYTLIIISTIQVLFLPAIIFFGKQLIEFFFNKTIEVKKTELAQNLENHKMQIEQENKNFQHQLDSKLQEFNIKFSSLHSERANVVKELFLKILVLQSSLNDLFKIDRLHLKDNINVLQNFTNNFNDFKRYFLPNKIYFSHQLEIKIEKFLIEYSKITSDCINILDQNNKNNFSTNDDLKWKELSEKFDDFSNEIIKELSDDFREILGVKN